MVQIGDNVKDTITGFAGVVTAKTEYLFGSPRMLVEAIPEDGGKPVSEWFEMARLEKVSMRDLREASALAQNLTVSLWGADLADVSKIVEIVKKALEMADKKKDEDLPNDLPF